jgi:uncharacterized membrane protein
VVGGTKGSVVLVGFASAEEAKDARAVVQELDRKGGPGVRDVAVVVRTPDGRVELHQTEELAAGEGAVAGGAAGLVAGLLLGIPVVGALVGILGGGGWGLRDTGLSNKRLRRIGSDVEPGRAVLCVLVDEYGLPKVREALARYGEVLDAGVDATAP